MIFVLYLLLFQAILGGFDVLWNHEYREKLPQRPVAALEQKIHGARELLYAVIFFALAGYQWHGHWVLPLTLVLISELMLTAWDFIVEDRTRILTSVERTTHLILSVNGGAFLALLIPVLWNWKDEPNQVLSVDYGSLSLLLDGFGVAVLLWGLRDLIAGIRLSNKPSVFPLSSGSLS
ncbi:MAG: hypothetical protein ACU85E_11900 [Gammaproteobacteria bacterium]